MSYHLYHTDGFVLRAWPVGESGRLYDLFTARLGRVMARASAVRELKSKLRYHLQDLNLVRLSLVRGQVGWRIVNAESNNLDLSQSALVREKRLAIARLARLLGRLVVAEGRRLNVYQEFECSLIFLTLENLTPTALANYEIMTVLRLLETLGYWPGSDSLKLFARLAPWRLELVESFTPHRALAAALIEEAIYHSHL